MQTLQEQLDSIYPEMLDSKKQAYLMVVACLEKGELSSGTACIQYKQEGCRLLINPEFWNTLTKSEKIFLLAHESLHFILEHWTLREICPNPKLLNVAADIYINEFLKLEGLTINSGLYANQFKFKIDLSTIEYYKLLEDLQEKKDKTGTSGSPTFDNLVDAESLNDNCFESFDLSEVEEQILKKEIEILNKSISERGLLKAVISSKINIARKPPVVNWKQVAKRFIGFVNPNLTKTTNRLSRKDLPHLPRIKTYSKPCILVGVDSSGSVSDEQLEDFFSEIRNMYREFQIDVCLWDQEVDEPYTYKGKTSLERTKAGGTNASCFINYANSKKRKYNFALCLTDGFIEPNPIDAQLPFLWIITEDGSLNFNHKSKKVSL